jgi:hypothetical protein
MNLFNWFRKLKKQDQSGYSPAASDINSESNVSGFVSDNYNASSEDNNSFSGFDDGDFGGGGSGGSFDDASSSDSSDSGDSGDSGSSSSD